jgi:hypothetical protein
VSIVKKDAKNTITHNRGDKGAIRLVNKKGTFKKDDKFTFSIVKKGDYSDIVFQKTFTVTEDCDVFYLTFTNEEMRIGDVISTKVTYWYEIDMNDDTTILGHDAKGDKLFILYPEAAKKEGDA